MNLYVEQIFSTGVGLLKPSILFLYKNILFILVNTGRFGEIMELMMGTKYICNLSHKKDSILSPLVAYLVPFIIEIAGIFVKMIAGIFDPRN